MFIRNNGVLLNRKKVPIFSCVTITKRVQFSNKTVRTAIPYKYVGMDIDFDVTYSRHRQDLNSRWEPVSNDWIVNHPSLVNRSAVDVASDALRPF